MPQVKKGRKEQKMDRNPSPAVSEQSTESVAQPSIAVEICEPQPVTKEPEGPDAEAEEPQVSQDMDVQYLLQCRYMYRHVLSYIVMHAYHCQSTCKYYHPSQPHLKA